MPSGLLLSFFNISVVISRCTDWKEILPCTCKKENSVFTTIICENMTSFEQVTKIMKGRFTPMDRVSLKLANSNLNDLSYRSFKELNMTIENLKLNHDVIGLLHEDTFEGLSTVYYLSLADTNLEEVPEHIWKRLPNLKTVDLGRAKIKELTENSFKDLHKVEGLLLPGNQITRMDSKSFPTRIQRLHIGRNFIRDLNNTLVNLSDLTWLFVNCNELVTLENQLPFSASNLILIHASQNYIEHIPQQIKSFPLLESLFLQQNRITSLDGALSKSRKLERVVLEQNNIHTLTEDDFTETEMLESLILGHNQITSLNNSLVNLRNLNFLNMTFNALTEFSFQEIIGLQELRSIDLSYNQISTIIGPMPNLVDTNIKLTELKLDHNLLETLNGAISGLSDLLRINLSFNRLKKISPDDLIGLDQLRLLDVSHNHLTTLEETSKTFLPKLSELKASNNYLTILEKDFHGLPVLCYADLSNNQIVALGRDLVSKTRCKIEHGVHEGTWDTLKIYLQDNPILCDAALPEISSAMEINHTRIVGVSQCPPLSEQPVTHKSNGFLGYIPEINNPDSSHSDLYLQPQQLREEPNVNPAQKANLRYQTFIKPSLELLIKTDDSVLQKREQFNESSSNNSSVVAQKPVVIDPLRQEQQITKLASDIEELRTRIDKLSNQSKFLISQQTLKIQGPEENK